jgi:GntR family transcriptional regulator/MocR family aminotransferase
MAVQPGGMHLLARFRDTGSDTELVRRAIGHGLLPAALSTQYLGRTRDHGLLLGFTNIAEEQASFWAKALASALGSAAFWRKERWRGSRSAML